MDSDGLKAEQSRLIIPRGEKIVFAGGKAMRVRTARRKTVMLSTGELVDVSIDDSGRVTQIDHTDGLSAVVRPQTITMRPMIHGG